MNKPERPTIVDEQLPKQQELPKNLAADVINRFKDKIAPDILEEIRDKIHRDEIPPAVIETINQFPPDKQRETIGMLSIARAAYLAVKELAGLVEPSRPKADNRQIYSLADELSSAIIKAGVAKLFPDYAHLDEEQLEQAAHESEKCWITDPVDGSAGIVRGLNTWAVGFALHEKSDADNDGSGITLGCVISPQGNATEVVFGGKGLGSFDWQGRPVKVSSITAAKDLSMSVGSRDVRETLWIASLQTLGKIGSRVYAGIDTQHAGVWLARGSIDLLVRMEQPSYDVAPVIAIVEGAGGKVREMNGLSVVVQRDKVRRHNLIAYNGTPEIIDLFDHTVNNDMDTITSNGATLVESLRSGKDYHTNTLIVRRDNSVWLRQTNRFGLGPEWDFSARAIGQPDNLPKRETQEELRRRWFNGELTELPPDSPNVPITMSVPEHEALAKSLGIEFTPDKIGVDNLPIDIGTLFEKGQNILPNLFLPRGGENRERTTCVMADIDANSEPRSLGSEGRWVELTVLSELLKHWNNQSGIDYDGTPISPLLAKYLKAWIDNPYNPNTHISADRRFFWVEEH